MAIYVITHKKFNPPFRLFDRKTLLVGAEKSNLSGFDYYDNLGKNISYKNKNYCELTGIYWLWKNVSDDHIGIEHYRRLFSHSFLKKSLLNDDEIKKILSKYDIILPFQKKFNMSIEKDYVKNSGYKKDLDNTRKIIQRKYPDYLNTYDNFMLQDTMSLYNMMILSSGKFDRYCSWLFDILFELEKETDITNYSEYQKRIYGFLAERLLNVWVIKNKLKVFRMGVISTEQTQSLPVCFLTGCKRTLLFYKKFLLI